MGKLMQYNVLEYYWMLLSGPIHDLIKRSLWKNKNRLLGNVDNEQKKVTWLLIQNFTTWVTLSRDRELDLLTVTYKSMGCIMCSVMSSLIFLNVQAVLVTLIVLSALFTNKYSCMQRNGVLTKVFIWRPPKPTKVFHFGDRISSKTAPQGFPQARSKWWCLSLGLIEVAGLYAWVHLAWPQKARSRPASTESEYR